MPPIPPVTKALMLICTAVFCLNLLVPLYGFLALFPVGAGFLPWQPLTYAFLQRDVVDLVFNMMALWMFGADLERLWGWKRFLQFLLACVVTAAVVGLLMMFVLGSARPVAFGGAAGIYGMLMAFAILFPERTIVPLIPPIPMKAKVFVVVFGGIVLLFNLLGGASLVELAALAGALGAWLHIRYFRMRRGSSSRGRR